MTRPTPLERSAHRAFRTLCQYHADHLAYADPTPAQWAEYAGLEQQYVRLQTQVDDLAIAAYERAWLATHPTRTPEERGETTT